MEDLGYVFADATAWYLHDVSNQPLLGSPQGTNAMPGKTDEQPEPIDEVRPARLLCSGFLFRLLFPPSSMHHIHTGKKDKPMWEQSDYCDTEGYGSISGEHSKKEDAPLLQQCAKGKVDKYLPTGGFVGDDIADEMPSPTSIVAPIAQAPNLPELPRAYDVASRSPVNKKASQVTKVSRSGSFTSTYTDAFSDVHHCAYW